MGSDKNLWDRLRWSDPLPITNELARHVGDGPIVYRVCAFDDGNKPRAIPRAAGSDTTGTLDVGESGRGSRRLRTLSRVFNGKKGSHRAAWEYRWYDFSEVFPLAQLRVQFVRVKSKEHAVAIECQLLEEYRTEYLDRPPLNASGGKADAVEAWLRGQGLVEPRDDQGWLKLAGIIPAEILIV
ncbi:MAG: hypothetical protein K8M05_25000 [Deltaproteobacteria bacterium]|nr:hypothetical protein [Kofleriaceae bacterium]